MMSQLPAWLHDVEPNFTPGAETFTSRWGFGTGSGCISISLNSEKIAAFAPMPRDSERAATTVTNGDLKSVRKASFRFGIGGESGWQAEGYRSDRWYAGKGSP